MKLRETVVYGILKGCPCVGTSLHSPYLSSGFGGRAGFDMNTSRFFPQGLLAAVTLVEGWAGYRGEGLEPTGRQCFPSVQWLSLPYWGVGARNLLGFCWTETPSLSPSWLSSLIVCAPPSQCQNSCPRRNSDEASGADVSTWHVLGRRLPTLFFFFFLNSPFL